MKTILPLLSFGSLSSTELDCCNYQMYSDLLLISLLQVGLHVFITFPSVQIFLTMRHSLYICDVKFYSFLFSFTISFSQDTSSILPTPYLAYYPNASQCRSWSTSTSIRILSACWMDYLPAPPAGYAVTSVTLPG